MRRADVAPALGRYREKRDFSHTPEPRGRAGRKQGRLRFVVQKHAARRLHYDFRLELDGVLKSWAVPNGPSLDPGVKRLAVHVEDHPLEYAAFEGVIPKGHYGAGKVIVWDEGVWTPEGDGAQAYRRGKLEFRLDGVKLRGKWKLVRMRGREEKGGRENWLLIKGSDAEVRRGTDAEISRRRPESVKTGIDIEEVGKGQSARKSRRLPPGARKKAMPTLVKPQLATLVEHAPTGTDWIYEIKYDGYRMLCRIRGGKASLHTRTGRDWTDRFSAQARELARLPAREAWIDGEVVVFGADGMTDFQALQNACSEGSDRDVTFMAFDLVYLDGHDLSRIALIERKRLLAELLAGFDNAAVRYSNHVEGTGKEIYEHACQHQLEGLIAKRSNSTYAPVRNRSWVKVKCRRRQEFVIGGYTEPQGSRSGFGALLLGVYEGTRLRYAGRVGTGFGDRLLGSLRKRFAALERRIPPFADSKKIPGRRLHWIEPNLVAEINFAGWTDDGVLRQASFVSLRDDKPPRSVRREQAASAPEKQRARKTPVGKDADVSGIRISHPERVLFQDPDFTKLDLARYYEGVAEWMLPHLNGRPLSLVRCPRGPGEECFFQKHFSEGAPRAVEGVSIREKKGKSGRYVVANSAVALIGLVQVGVIEFHTWGAPARRPDAPDVLILDLDPDPHLLWGRVVEAATLARTLFDEIGLKSYLKTTGGKGLHVVVPLGPGHDWEEVKAFARAAAEHMERTFPRRYTSKMAKAGRKGKIFIDYLRNSKGATAVAAYSVRARAGGPVAVPLAWNELEDGVRSDSFNVGNVMERLRGLRSDPWRGFFESRQKLTRDMKRALGADG